MDFPLCTGPTGPVAAAATGTGTRTGPDIPQGRAGRKQTLEPPYGQRSPFWVSLRIVGSRPHGRQPRRAHPVIVCPCRAAGAAHHHRAPNARRRRHPRPLRPPRQAIRAGSSACPTRPAGPPGGNQ